MRVLLLEEARDDLIQIRRYIARENPGAAKRVAGRLRAAMQGLAGAPHIGRPGRWPGTRELIVPGTPYLIPYRLCEDVVEVLRVFDARRSWPDTSA